jgi:hypothetical protein
MRDAHCMPLGVTLLIPATLLLYFAGLTDTRKKSFYLLKQRLPE